MNLTEAIQSIDLDEVIDRLNAYAISQLKSVGVKNFNGKEPIDFVGDVLLKVMEGQRDWSKANCSFTEFLFGCLKSEISNFFKSNKNIYDNELHEISNTDNSSSAEELRNSISDNLKLEGADDDELTIFEYWADGITKPSEIAKDLGIDVKEVYNITKRLQRRLSKTHTQLKNII
jgi:DNA-directed RNA polymerase specialized sigma24 family protein